MTFYQQVRAHAVRVLERADDEELQCYLLQLVQALRFERSDKSRLSQFLVQRCICVVVSLMGQTGKIWKRVENRQNVLSVHQTS